MVLISNSLSIALLGLKLGTKDGTSEGAEETDGAEEGDEVGFLEGNEVGALLGAEEGDEVGFLEGNELGALLGTEEGDELGTFEMDGEAEGADETSVALNSWIAELCPGPPEPPITRLAPVLSIATL